MTDGRSAAVLETRSKSTFFEQKVVASNFPIRRASVRAHRASICCQGRVSQTSDPKIRCHVEATKGRLSSLAAVPPCHAGSQERAKPHVDERLWTINRNSRPC